jgi:hypothetical protein
MTRNTNRKPKLLILCPLAYIGSMTFVMEGIQLFKKKGYSVNILVSDNCDPPLDIDSNTANIYHFTDKGTRRGAKYSYFLVESFRLVSKSNYDLVIGISQIGLIVSSLVHLYKRIPIVFFNDEIWFGNERTHFYENIVGYVMKVFEVIANQFAILTITQDPFRAFYLSRVNKISEQQIRYLPNSQPGVAENIKSTYLHDLLGIAKNRNLILWMGAVSPGDGALELARNSQRLPADYALVFHFRSKNVSNYMKNIMDHQDKKSLYISNKPVNYEMVTDIVNSASIGIGIYARKGINTEYIGYSSGKINSFLKGGIPVVVSNFKGLSWIEKSNAGIQIDNMDEIWNAFYKISQNYDYFQANTLIAYDNHLRYDRYFDALSDEIKHMLN